MSGMGGEGGHIPLVENGFACGCGGQGCLEQYASATAICRAATRAAGRGGAPRIAKLIARRVEEQTEFSARDLAGLAREGDQTARQIFADAGKYLGMGLATLVNVFNLPLYVIGGGVVSGWESLRPAHVRGTAPAELHLRPDRTTGRPALHPRQDLRGPGSNRPRRRPAGGCHAPLP